MIAPANNKKKSLSPSKRHKSATLAAICAFLCIIIVIIISCLIKEGVTSSKLEGETLPRNKPLKNPISASMRQVYDVSGYDSKSENHRVQVKQVTMHTNMYGYVINRPHTAIVITNKVNDADKPIEERIFTNSADQKIAALLLLEPGEIMIGDASSFFGKGFTRSFLRSIETPIVVTKNDDEFTANLKRAVIDTKLELKVRYDEGEDIAQLMLKERNELQALGLYREELKEEIHKLARDKSLSEEAMQDFINAANKMLEERGGKPLEMPRFAARRFLLQQQFETQNNEE